MPHIPLREIAQRAGVSRMTVSRVIRNAPHVSPEIRSRVESALRKLDYSPNPLLGVLMQSLRSNRAGKAQNRSPTPANSGWLWCSATRTIPKRP